MADLEGVLSTEDITFEEAEKYFGKKIPLTTKEFYQLSEKYSSLAFTVSGYTEIQVIKKFYDEVLAAIEEGTTLKTFKDNMNSFLENNGYEGITNFQADNIYRTNIQTAYQVGHYEQMTSPMVKTLRPYWQYDAVNDSHTRKSHLAMDGKVFPADSPVWDVWYPPNGFRCRCGITTLSKRQVEERGLVVENEVPYVAKLGDGSYVNIIPDAAFASNPAKQSFEPDLKDYPKVLKKAYEKLQSNK